MQYVSRSASVKAYLHYLNGKYSSETHIIMESIGSIVANLHNANIIHGDLTTSNFLLQPKSESIEFADSDELSDALIIVKIIKNPCLIYCIDF